MMESETRRQKQAKKYAGSIRRLLPLNIILSLTFYRFPERQWKHIRTNNVIERSLKEVERGTRVIGRFPNETSALVMVFSLLEEERMKWQKVGMTDGDILRIAEVSKALEQEPIKLEFLEEALFMGRSRA